MSWMARWAGGFPVFVQEAKGARVVDVDGHEYVDLCLGDTGAMAGHSPEPVVQALAAQAARGSTAMLPTEDAAWVGEELARRFGLPFWQFALTATDANRFALRLAREVTGRGKVLVFDWCYHGSVDEALAATAARRRRAARRERRAARSPGADDEGRPVQRPRRARAGASRTGRRLRPRRARADEHRDRPPGRRVPRRAPRADPQHGHAARDRRDAHAERRPRRLHTGLGPRARHRHGRQGDRRRDARRRVRRLGRARRADHGTAPRPTTRTRAGSAGRWPATRSRSQQSARPSSTCSPKTRSRGRSRSPNASRRTCRETIEDAALPWHVTQARLPRRVPLPAPILPARAPKPRPRSTPSSTATCTSSRSTGACS